MFEEASTHKKMLSPKEFHFVIQFDTGIMYLTLIP